MKKLIINADDFGLDEETVEWTIKGFETGKLTSATIMAGMRGTARAVEFAKAYPQFSFGVHLYLVDEKPMCKPGDIPSMIDPKTGKLWVTRQFIVRNFLGLIKVEDIKREMRAQVESLLAMGLKISHVDGHGHNHRLPQSIKALKALQAEGLLGFDRVRRCQDLFFGKSGLLARLINKPMQKKFDGAFKMTDHFLMTAGHTDNPKWFTESLATLPDGITEIGIHPGITEDWRRIDTEDCFAADLSGVELTNFNEI